MSVSFLLPPSGFFNPAELTNCTVATCNIITSFYNYRINLVPNAVFVSFFSLALLSFISIWIATRRGFFFMLAMALGLAAEIIGYIGRIVSYKNQWNQNGFLIQIICITLGPAFFSAAVYLCLARIVRVYGAENSWIPPKWYTRTFIPCDIIAMILQGVGGTLASIALQTGRDLKTGVNCMIAGLASQVFTLFVFMALCVAFAFRVQRRRRRLGDAAALSQEPHLVRLRLSWHFRGFVASLAFATGAIFWRSVYRVAELNQGWLGPLTFNQYLFVGFEGVLMVLVAGSLAIFHPALCLGVAMDGIKHDANGPRNEKTTKDGEMARGADGLMSQNHAITNDFGDAKEARYEADKVIPLDESEIIRKGSGAATPSVD